MEDSINLTFQPCFLTNALEAKNFPLNIISSACPGRGCDILSLSFSSKWLLFYLHFTNKETESQKSEGTCLRPQSEKEEELGFESKTLFSVCVSVCLSFSFSLPTPHSLAHCPLWTEPAQNAIKAGSEEKQLDGQEIIPHQ